ncbi:ketosteroid isomerase-like protein [Allocatelliglobosispora scoriae]|uniref:Ketosteroid isomerase-like protein n=1 Tax=Allocatelliglobosispora scoriae TaxID=643052 RepID=A0A841BJS7_9ACTN|nr:nuclear transport factor 2 family protein [Allocatelliglobosispora scoriae]MBB5867151.1 ketosteroid isomerase-like protein [Allocatelliglobosispora scoriae]
MEPLNVIEELWHRIAERDWAGVGELFADGAVVEWPVSGEKIVGRANFIAVNSEYPEGWTINLLRIVAQEESVVSEVEVPHAGLGVFRAASFWTVIDGQITHGREYWTSLGGDPAPLWRARYVEALS